MTLQSKSNKGKQGHKFSRLETFMRDLAAGTKPQTRGIPAFRHMWRRLGKSDKAISGAEAIALEEILDDLCPNDISENGNSRAVVDEWIQKAVLEVLDKKSDAKDLDHRITRSIEALKERLKSPAVRWEVWQFVEGLVIPKDEFQFGTATFYRLQSDYVKNRPKEFIQNFETARGMAFLGNFWGRDFEPSPNSLVCRIYVNATDGAAAVRIAESDLDTILGVLNFFAPSLPNKTGIPTVTVTGKVPTHQTLNRKALAEKIAFTEAPKPNFRGHGTFYGNVSRFDIRSLERSPETQKLFNKASSFLKGEGEKAFRERILIAMKWAGKGEAAENNEDAFLFFALALESLILGGKNKDELRYRFALRLAHLLGSTRVEKSKIRDFTKKNLYDVRSVLVHTGKAPIPDSDLNMVKRIATESIYKLTNDERFADVVTDDALENWFEGVLMK